MELHDFLPWDLDAVQRFLLIKEELALTRQRIRTRCLLASLSGDTADGVLTFSCSAGLITLQPDGHFEISAAHD